MRESAAASGAPAQFPICAGCKVIIKHRIPGIAAPISSANKKG